MNTQQALKRISMEARRRVIPWTLLVASALMIGVAVGCAIYAIH